MRERIEKDEKVLLIESTREGYAPHQCTYTLTVGELIDILSDYDDDTPVLFSNDHGYTYGSMTEDSFRYSKE